MVVVSSGSFPLGSLTVVEQGLGFLVSGGGQGLQLFAPRLGQTICSFIAWNLTMDWDPMCNQVLGEAAGLSAAG